MILRSCLLDVLKGIGTRCPTIQKMKRILDQEKVSLRAKIRELLGFLKQGIRLCFQRFTIQRTKAV